MQMDGCATHDINHICQMIFLTNGLPGPLKIATDNGASFTSTKFCQFMEQITSKLHQLSMNRLVERAVQTSKGQSKECLIFRFRRKSRESGL